MKDNVTDFNKFKADKIKKEEEKYNIELLQNILSKKPEELSGGEKFVYAQIKLLIPFQIKSKYTMGIIEFRGGLYVVNATPFNTFEYLGTIEEVISKFMGW